ncbi:hypothetical protein [Caviibacterium pharyngocola]|uniref:Uncharacterized protein n=1 Tax=Caviibacterium pharyngocola TaxID=28159 RepID=A0A2M8RU36_9PAST|nr:hypothetical protein [Caviibacterium pharyngocola]PJG82402.1 hypothetical protein CVP04_08660 [Caviibacterium pharyngocola]
MTQSTLNADLSKMSYDEFQDFMKGLALLYSGTSSNHNFISIFNDLRSIAKRVERLPFDFFTIYGAYEIKDNQVVVAVFRIDIDSPADDNTAPNMTSVEVSFADDERNLRCSARIRKYLTQPEYVARCELAYPPVMEDLLWEKEYEKRRGTKVNLNLSEEDKKLLLAGAIKPKHC